ncbi:hypothetical protein [Actinomadura flavalba]|uniref:hypothetical protein n=1 Tax=Actinomadura flavalba TaxID=1120938 RepID=UPI00035F13E1|nr:hypothetical protein [Actinomadura flavalba]
MRSTRKLTLASVTAVSGLLFALTPGTAHADASDLTARPTAKPKAGAAQADVITCKITAHNPHYSHHAHAADKHRVNVTADVKCTKKVGSLKIKVILYKNGKKYKESGWKTATGKNRVSTNAARRCVKKQTYQAKALATVVFPPRYTPPSGSGYDWSTKVRINACKKGG